MLVILLKTVNSTRSPRNSRNITAQKIKFSMISLVNVTKFPADMFLFTEGIFNGKLHFCAFCTVYVSLLFQKN